MTPQSAVSDLVNKGGAYANCLSKRVTYASVLNQLAYCTHLGLRQLMPRLILPAQIDKPRLPLASRILSQSHPLKILRPIVGLVAVDVVNREIGLVALTKGLSDKSVDSIFFPPIIVLDGNFQIATFRYRRRKNFPGPTLRNAFATSCALHRSRKRPYSAKVRYFQPRNGCDLTPAFIVHESL